MRPSFKWKIERRLYGAAAAARRLGLDVGQGCRILSCHVSSEPWLVSIGDHVTISTEVLFVTHDGTGWLFEDESGDRYYRYARIRIGSHCFIGTRSIIMPGVQVGDRSIVAAGTVLHRSVPPGSVVGGNPARIIGSYEDFKGKVQDHWRKGSDRRGQTYREQTTSIAEDFYVPSLARD